MKPFLISFLLLASCIVYCQSSSSIKGLVQDRNSGQPLAFASVVLIKKDTSESLGTITDEDGKFQLFNVMPGTYLITIEYIGYAPQENLLELRKAQQLTLPTVILEEAAELLEGVTITAEKSTVEQKLDRKVVNVGKDLISQGPSAADLMNNLPSVNVNSDGNISFRGSNNVRILVDGKLSNLENPAEVLQQIPSNTIKKIELITNPSARYNPDGLNGIINIILKKSGNEGWNAAFGANSIIAQRERYNSNLSLNYRPGKTNVYLEYAKGFGDQVTDGIVNRFDLNSNQLTRNINNRKSDVLKIGVDLYPTDKTVLSFFTNQNFYRAAFDGTKAVLFDDGPANNLTLNDLLIRNNHTQVYNVDYRWNIDGETHFLELEGNYNRFKSDLENDFDFSGNTSVPSYTENVEDRRNVLTFNLDYRLPISKKSSMELGTETRINTVGNDYRTSSSSLENSIFEYDRDIHSLYAILNTSFGKVDLNAGTRFEYYLVDATFDQEASGTENFDQKLFNIFPSLFLSYRASEESPHQYQLSYGRRIERPSFNQVNPIRQTTTPQLLATGNLRLLPQFSNTLEANYLYQFGKGSLSTSVFYRRIQDEINRIGIFDQDDPNLLRLSYDNFDSNDAYGVELGLNLGITAWWRVNTNLELYHRQQRGSIEGEAVVVQNTLANVKWTNNFKISKKFTGFLFGFYSGRQEILQYELKPNYYLNTGLRYAFAEGRGSISLNLNDVFGTQRFAFETFRTVFQEGEFLRDTQQLFIGVSYRIGGKLTAASRKKRNTNIKADRFL